MIEVRTIPQRFRCAGCRQKSVEPRYIVALLTDYWHQVWRIHATTSAPAPLCCAAPFDTVKQA